MQASILFILDYLLQLKQQRLAVPSIKVHLTVILALHPGSVCLSVFANRMVGRFLKGLDRLYPQVRWPIPLWDLSLVLSRLMGPPFEPLATFSLLYLVAITAARRVSELKALTSKSPYTVFYKDKVQLQPSHMLMTWNTCSIPWTLDTC